MSITTDLQTGVRPVGTSAGIGEQEHMIAEKPYLELALGLIQRQHYDEARTVLERVRDHATAQKWLLWLDQYAPVAGWKQDGDVTYPNDNVQPTAGGQYAVVSTEVEIESPEAVLQRLQIPTKSQLISLQLARMNRAIEDVNHEYRHNALFFLTGVVTLPALGVGLVLMGYSALNAIEKRHKLHKLYSRRRALLLELEGRYSTVTLGFNTRPINRTLPVLKS